MAPRLSEHERAVIRLLLRRPVAGCARAELSAGLAWLNGQLLGVLADLVDSERVTITGDAAEHVRLLPGEALMHGQQPSADGLRWVAVRIGRRHVPLRQSLTASDDRRRPSRTDTSETDDDGFPWPIVILTGSGTTWHEGARPCPVCEGRRLRPGYVCLSCLRWHLDHRIRYQYRLTAKGVRA